MYHRRRPFLMIALLLAIGLRSALGAPCCVDRAVAADGVADSVAMAADSHHTHDAHHGHDGEGGDHHSEHGDSPTANPCCSACGPTLPAEPVSFALTEAKRLAPEAKAIRALATRPPYPAYEATGPPLLI
ncbi:MAG: DUF2946 family protein [Pseudomonadota bacterium]